MNLSDSDSTKEKPKTSLQPGQFVVTPEEKLPPWATQLQQRPHQSVDLPKPAPNQTQIPQQEVEQKEPQKASIPTSKPVIKLAQEKQQKETQQVKPQPQIHPQKTDKIANIKNKILGIGLVLTLLISFSAAIYFSLPFMKNIFDQKQPIETVEEESSKSFKFFLPNFPKRGESAFFPLLEKIFSESTI